MAKAGIFSKNHVRTLTVALVIACFLFYPAPFAGVAAAAGADVSVLDVEFNLYNYEAKVTFSSPVDATGAVYYNFELRNWPINWDIQNFSNGFADKRKADTEGRVWIFTMIDKSGLGLPGTSYEGGDLYYRIGLDDTVAGASGIRDVRDNTLLPRYNITIPKAKIFNDSGGEQDFKGYENHFVPRRLEAEALTVEQGALTRPAAFAGWRSVYWVKPAPGATSLGVSVTVATGLSAAFKQDGASKTASINGRVYSASFGLNNGKAMSEIEITVSDGKSARSYFLDVCGQDPQGHNVVADYYDMLPYPSTKKATRALVDQITGGYAITPQRIDFVANYLAGSQKNYRELIGPVKALNPNWHSLHYHLAIWNGEADIIINNAWSKAEWLYLTNELFQQDPHIFMYAVHKNTGRTSWLRDYTWGAYLMNISNENYYQLLLNNLDYQCSSTGYDSIFLDSFALGTVYSFTGFNYINYGAGNDVPYQFTGYANPQLGGLTWLQASEEFISRLNKDLNRRGIWLLPNHGNMMTSWDPLDYALTNGGMLEAVPMRPDNSPEMGSYYYLYDWVQSMSRTMYLTQKDRVIILQPYLPEINDLKYRLFVLGEYLLVKGNHTYLNLCVGGQSQASWYPEYEIDLGAPTQTHQIPDTLFTPWKESIDKALLNYKEGELFIRRFEKGLVILNPHKSAQPYNVPGDKPYQAAVISGGGTVPETGLGDLAYSLSWVNAPSGARNIPAESALILRFEQPLVTYTGAIRYQESSIRALVTLCDSDGDAAATEYTNVDGTYTLTIPAPQEGARYTLIVTKPGYLSYTIRNLSLAGSTVMETVDIHQLAGDVNGDGIINAVDLAQLLSEFNRDPLNFKEADIDGNGVVNATDLTYLLAGFNKRNVIQN